MGDFLQRAVIEAMNRKEVIDKEQQYALMLRFTRNEPEHCSLHGLSGKEKRRKPIVRERTDIHRPTAMIPSDYRWLAGSYPAGEDEERNRHIEWDGTNVGGTIQTIKTAGLWGIESDSKDEYIASLERSEVEYLFKMLASMGFPVEGEWKW